MSEIKIKQIKVGEKNYDIDAKYLGGHTFDEIEGMIHDAIDTYVIPESHSDAGIVVSSESTVTISKENLLKLVSNPPISVDSIDADYDEIFNLGDVILMESISDGVKIFDRWISNVSGTGKSAVLTLAVLETKVAKHHHTIDVASTKGNAVTGGTKTYSTTKIPLVGDAVTVLTGEAGSYITSVTLNDNGKHDLKVVSTDDKDTDADVVAHSHTVDAHAHGVSFNPQDFIEEGVDAYTALDTATYVPFTAEVVEVADVQSNDSTITFATGSGSTDTFIKTLADSTLSTGEETLTTGANTGGLTTVEDDTLTTTEASAHSHTVDVETTSAVVTDVTLADSVITAVNYTHKPSDVAAEVVTGVSVKNASTTVTVDKVSGTGASTKPFTSDWTLSDDGVLSLVNENVDSVITASATASATTTVELDVKNYTQSADTLTITSTPFEQSATTGKVSSKGSTSNSGAHTHGFSHVHSIPTHTHTIAAHSHEYVKSVMGTTGAAYVSLATTTHATHTHGKKSVVWNVVDGNSAFTYVTGGSKTAVVKDLKDASLSYTSTSETAGTDTKYIKLAGDIAFPGLTTGSKTLSTTTVTPAVAGSEIALKDITFSEGDFVTDVTVEPKTSANIGGDPTKA